MSKLVFLSGAGLSAPSGLSTFRDNDGLWEQYDLDIVCNYQTWIKNFNLVHEFYNKRRFELRKVTPNKMHEKIAEISKRFEVINFTQNVDDLLERAGCENVIHLHGKLLELHCTNCKDITKLNLNDDLEFKFENCKKCQSKLIKPSVVFFGEQAPFYTDLYSTFYNLNEDDLVVIIGTSGAVININYLLRFAKSKNILINLEKNKYINEALFSHIIYKSCDECIDELEQIIQEWNS
ncbi:NAD-dependent deacetylase [Campylobacter sp. RM12640]|uniref:SIR2 family NAD-dependent protein deacylase n=1 Tax=unclassified Campylobacter TaxID=2593542 RepID=UPI0030151E60|nr:NAD-dependent deacetylase [Campylobacter sp. RM12640]MBZ7988519.1 NAD-dependent deacetylase [Campylobacter sp. RM12635]